MRDCWTYKLEKGAHQNRVKMNEIGELVKSLKEQYRELERELNELERASEGPKPRYTVKATIGVQSGESPWSSLRDAPAGSETIRFLVTPAQGYVEACEARLNHFGRSTKDRASVKSSVTYYRFHGVLMHCSGGTTIIKTPQLCSDEQWEELKKGNIPEDWK